MVRKSITSTIIAFFFSLSLLAQNENNKTYQASKIQDSSLHKENKDGLHHLYFPELYNEKLYYNKKELAEINTLFKEKNTIELIPLLEEYVAQFRIENFSQDTDLLWKLAQLYEINERMVEAKSVYRLVLKHHRKDKIQEIQQYFKINEHYDDLTDLERHHYVPLDYYYELLEARTKIDTLIPPHSVLLNMGDEINQKNIPDYAPSINFNDQLMIFTKRTLDSKSLGVKKSFNENLYYSQQVNGLWESAKPFPKPILSLCNEGSAIMTLDGETLYFTRCIVPEYSYDCPDCIGDCDIYSSTKNVDDSTWNEPLNLGTNINTVTWESQPTLSQSEDTLYFVSDRKDGFGMTDIYFTYKNDLGEWVSAINMGPIINTRGSEFSPFLSKDVFYFSSNGQILNLENHLGERPTKTLDIYKAYKYKDYWQEPLNVGPLVNGPGNEYYFSMDKSVKNLYYAKTEEDVEDNHYTDLFSFPVPMEAQPTATTTLNGVLADNETGDPYKGIVSIIDMENGIEVAPREVRKDGTYEFDLIDHNRYLLVVQGDDFFRIEKLFELDGDTTIAVEAVSISNRKLSFSSIEFEKGKSKILEDMAKDLWDVINFMVDHRSFNLTIGGHTDSHGDSKLNLILSQDRANAIKNFLVEKGLIDEERITPIGYGDTMPIMSPELTDEDKRINRRVEFNISRSSSLDDDIDFDYEYDSGD
jgi:outer membrane protein OmpA-like peptidoglycan-associated protein